MNNAKRWLDISKMYALTGTCKRRNYGCVVVDPKGILVSRGATTSKIPCTTCKRRFSRKGHGYDKCPSIHAEQFCVTGVKIPKGSIAYLTCFDAVSGKEILNPRPCATCERLLKLAGISKVITRTEVIDYEAE